MCRLLAITADENVDTNDELAAFAQMCKESAEYQGHGWGCAWFENGRWNHHHSITPIWEDTLPSIPRTQRFVAHARSAFRNEGITIENTMPFGDDERVFIFNGELRGVRITSHGRIGAEKIYNYILRFGTDDIVSSLRKAIRIIERRTERIRAMNIIIADREGLTIATHHTQEPEYFTMHRVQNGPKRIVCSQPLGSGWIAIPNKTIEVIV